ncbi:Cytochrome b-245 chaperone [Dirofilaria immitis]
MPIFAYLLNQKIPMNKISLAERRLIVLAFSFWIGASTHFILINWDLGIISSPPLYSPTLVALLFEFVGPMIAYNRPLLLLNTIGIASCVCFTYAYYYACFTFKYFYTSLIAIASSFYNMQQHLADPKLGYVLLPIYSMYNQLLITLLFGHYQWNRNLNTITPNTLDEQYTLLLQQLH